MPNQVVFFPQSKYRQLPQSFKYTAVTDTPSLLHAKLSNQITNEVKLEGSGMGFLKTVRLSKICVNICGVGAGEKHTCLHGGLERKERHIWNVNIFQREGRLSWKSGLVSSPAPQGQSRTCGLLEAPSLRPHPRPLESTGSFSRVLTCFPCTLKFESTGPSFTCSV